jgi:hypothetical protein
MILRQFAHRDPVVTLSYLFGCGGKGGGAVVDPVSEPGFYQAEAEPEEFLELMLRDIPPRPDDAAAIRAANPGLREVVATA